MDFLSNYEIPRTANFIHSGNYSRVALQFPDELLKDSTRVVKALRDELRSLARMDVGIFVMADTTYGSCCVDEVGASHVDADCVVHYGHTCLSPTSTLPALFIFGKASIDIDACVESLSDCLATGGKPVMVLYGLEYAHSIQSISEAMRLCGSKIGLRYAEVRCSVMIPSEFDETWNAQVSSFDKPADHGDLQKCDDSCNISKTDGSQISSTVPGMSYSLGGLMWNLPEGHKMEDYLLFWIGSDNPAFANVVLTFNNCEIVRYSAEETCLVKDYSHQKKILMRRYYLVEKAKDANIVGILVGTLGVAGYLHMIHQMKELIAAAGKKAYTLVMGRPNPAKLANFPECDVFIYVSCPQTALFDSKEFLAPVITPFEGTLAFSRDRRWTGAYVMEFHDLLSSSLPQVADRIETRYSFFTGGYVEDYELQGEKEREKDEGELALVEETKKALKVGDEHPSSILVKGTAKSVAEYYASRSYHGLDMHSEKGPHSFVVGRMGKASGYIDEKQNHENTL